MSTNQIEKTQTACKYDEAQVREIYKIAARIEDLGKKLIFGFPRTSPGAIALVHKAEHLKNFGRGRFY